MRKKKFSLVDKLASELLEEVFVPLDVEKAQEVIREIEELEGRRSHRAQTLAGDYMTQEERDRLGELHKQLKQCGITVVVRAISTQERNACYSEVMASIKGMSEEEQEAHLSAELEVKLVSKALVHVIDHMDNDTKHHDLENNFVENLYKIMPTSVWDEIVEAVAAVGKRVVEVSNYLRDATFRGDEAVRGTDDGASSGPEDGTA